MKVHFIDVGQGDATLFEFPCAAVLVDTGGEQNGKFKGREALIDYLDAFFARRADLRRTFRLVALTHAHIDHTRGIDDLLDEGFRIENAVINGQAGGSGWEGQKRLLDHAVAKKLPYLIVEFDELADVRTMTGPIIDPVDCRLASPSVDVDPEIRILWGRLKKDPGWGYEIHDGQRVDRFDNKNNHSLVIRVGYGESSVLLTGDLEEHAIPSLLSRYPGTELKADVYQVGHHGSHNGTTPALLDRIEPKIAVISMGPSYRKCSWWWKGPCYMAYAYGHPRQSVVKDLEDSVSLDRRKSKPEQVAQGPKDFKPEPVTKCIYGTGWTGTVILSMKNSGWIDVVEPAGEPCGGTAPS